MADVQTRFQAALDVIQSLPKDGPYRPAPAMLLMFYAYYKQATEGPCTKAKPWSFDVINKAKWDAWNKLGSMAKEDAMDKYVQELTKVMQDTPQLPDDQIIEVLPASDESNHFVQTLGNFYELVNVKNPGMEKLRQMTGGSNGDVPVNGNHVQSNGHPTPNTKPLNGVDRQHPELVVEVVTETPPETGNGHNDVIEDRGDLEIRSESEEEFCDPSADLLEPKNDSMSQSDTSSLSDSITETPTKSNVSAVEELLGIEQSKPLVDGGEKGTRGEDAVVRKTGHQSPDSGTPRRRRHRVPDRQVHGGGAGGSGEPWRSQTDKHAEIEERIAVVLLQLQRDMHSVLNRLTTLETIIIARQQDTRCLQGNDGKRSDAVPAWWPFTDIHPRTAFFFIVWPFVARFILNILRRYASRRRC